MRTEDKSMLVVTRITPTTGEAIDISGGEWTRYVRYSADYWMVWMGDSLEMQDDCEALEAAYQSYKK